MGLQTQITLSPLLSSIISRRRSPSSESMIAPLANLDQALRAVSGDFLERPATTDRLHGDLMQAKAFG